MPARSNYSPALKALFRRKPVATVIELRRGLGVRSRTTILGALTSVGYLTSYSHAGKYYTLKEIPDFNERGLWFRGEVRFSKHGTLRKTAIVLVTEAPGGYTHEELAVIVGLRVHDTLRSLVEANEIGRVRIEVAYIYVAADPAIASAQLSHREGMTAAAAAVVVPTVSSTAPALVEPTALGLERVIDVLLAVIHAPTDSTRTIAARLRADGIVIANEQVATVFEQYGLGKKTARSRSRRSHR
jgi:hypothetical protein